MPVLPYEIFTHCYITNNNNTQNCKWHKLGSVREDSWFCSSHSLLMSIYGLYMCFHTISSTFCLYVFNWRSKLITDAQQSYVTVSHSSRIAGVQYTIRLHINSLLLVIFCTSEQNTTIARTQKLNKEMDDAKFVAGVLLKQILWTTSLIFKLSYSRNFLYK